MSEAGDFVDAALQREGTDERADADRERLGGGLEFYGASVGAIRGTVRDAMRRYRGLAHDDVTALASELWAVPVFERRLAAVVLLQSNVALLKNSDLTRLEGFVRSGRMRALVDPLAVDALGPLIAALPPTIRSRADVALDRWAQDGDVWLARAVLLGSLPAIRAGTGDPGRFARRGRAALAATGDSAEVRDAIEQGIAVVGPQPGL